ncbi:hypothetical protein QUF54_11320 [Candidatus Marithioploca araucensis]|uniref:PIN domain-containing protein n=1 Tax=Candidatus Marithioploca araucensis TaxID=70273 RepID=A0ABT7VWH5_9GAMM|nr:hypothetical protein [Candidatus Marithioploca araucensis]
MSARCNPHFYEWWVSYLPTLRLLDTNILIAIIGRKSLFRWIFDQIIAGQLILCVS